ncbi:MAG: 4-hydroxy-tetrahydrodipicolinate synthase [Hyphomicrobiales bacterium]|nr:4-hydroxy-tetrahydrodipicolinate synthase [Hyphomicrobiales bacterium]
MFKGSYPALVTPFTDNGQIDEKAFRDFIDWQIDEGSDGLVPVGTTGESPTLTHDEHKNIVKICIKQARGRVPVIAGAGSNNTSEAVDFALSAQKQGAQAVLVVTPYYNKPNQQGMKLHFSTIADAIDIGVFIYNIPGRSIVDMSVNTMRELFEKHDNIIGVKDATAKVERVSEQRLAMGSDFIQFSGEDASALGFSAHGGTGCISVTANVAPRLCADMQKACNEGRYLEARDIQDRLMPLHRALFIEPNPGGAKYALSVLGKIKNVQRSPLVPIEQNTQSAIRDAMVHAGLIN